MRPNTLKRFNSPQGVSDYQGKFERQKVERIKDWHEQRLVAGLIQQASAVPSRGLALDLPSGFGRFFPALRQAYPHVVEGDWSWPMLQTAQSAHAEQALAFVRASAVALPFASNSFDLVFSVRLCHHFPSDAERDRYIREVFRVSKGWVILSYLDQQSIHNRLRSALRRLKRKRPKQGAASSDNILRTAADQGFQVVQSVAFSRFFSGQRYVLCRSADALREGVGVEFRLPLKPIGTRLF